MRNRTSDCGAARVCKGINLRGREAYATVPNSVANWEIIIFLLFSFIFLFHHSAFQSAPLAVYVHVVYVRVVYVHVVDCFIDLLRTDDYYVLMITTYWW